MDWIVSPKFICWSPNPSVSLQSLGADRDSMKSKGWSLNPTGLCRAMSAMWGQRERTFCNPGRIALTRIRPCWTLTSHYQPSELWETFLLFKLSSLASCYSSLNRLRQVVRKPTESPGGEEGLAWAVQQERCSDHIMGLPLWTPLEASRYERQACTGQDTWKQVHQLPCSLSDRFLLFVVHFLVEITRAAFHDRAKITWNLVARKCLEKCFGFSYGEVGLICGGIFQT